MSKRVGIFAGSFDPIHLGHTTFARQALDDCGLNKIFFLVEPRPRRKQGVRALTHRTAMVQLATADEPNFGTIMIEQTRFSVNETLPILQAMFKGAELHLLFGDDVLKHLAEWPHVNELVSKVNFIIGVRGHLLDEAQDKLKALERSRNLKLNYKIFEAKSPELSSSQIRLSFKRGYQPANLDPKIVNYIEENQLYSSLSKS